MRGSQELLGAEGLLERVAPGSPLPARWVPGCPGPVEKTWDPPPELEGGRRHTLAACHVLLAHPHEALPHLSGLEKDWYLTVIYKPTRLRRVGVGWPVIYRSNWDTAESYRRSFPMPRQMTHTSWDGPRETRVCHYLALGGFSFSWPLQIWRKKKKKEKERQGKNIQITPPLIGRHEPNWKLNVARLISYRNLTLLVFLPFLCSTAVILKYFGLRISLHS